MSNILKAIHDDMEWYETLCERFNEKPQRSPDAYGNMLLDCYGKHADKLQERYDREVRSRKN